MHSVSFFVDGKVFTIMFSHYSLASLVPRAHRDARQRKINTK
jgi:hypothetical protein